MSHEISTVSGKAEVFTVGTPPWHKLGVTVPHSVTSDVAMQLAG